MDLGNKNFTSKIIFSLSALKLFEIERALHSKRAKKLGQYDFTHHKVNCILFPYLTHGKIKGLFRNFQSFAAFLNKNYMSLMH